MTKSRVLAIGLDGYEQSLGQHLMDSGQLPNLEKLRQRSACFLLDHGPATRTGLAWEHAATGLSPQAAGRASAVDFDPQTYETWHAGTSLTPFAAFLDKRTVVFDAPYFDLSKAPAVHGVVNWGAHDPGIASGSRPDNLWDELIERFGDYPASKEMYDVVWPSPERTQAMGQALVQATNVRTRASRWLLQERLPDWELAFVVAGEIHSAIENLWHGIDTSHPLHHLPSSSIAAKGLIDVYRATDTLIGELVGAFPDATVVAFAMNGMGPNHSDVASMVLLPELLYRDSTGNSLLRTPRSWANAAGGIPLLDPETPWSQAIMTQIRQYSEPLDSLRRVAANTLPEAIKKLFRSKPAAVPRATNAVTRFSLEWMPSSLYQPHWPGAPYFALPSFYDGRVRINLAGRETQGCVAMEDYEATCDRIEALVRCCRDSRTGEPVVKDIIRCGGPEPLALGPTECDLIIVWNDVAYGLDHPELGRIGPVPPRRTGGHTGPYGMAFIAAEHAHSGSFGVHDSWDIVPTMFELLNEQVPAQLSGKSMQV